MEDRHVRYLAYKNKVSPLEMVVRLNKLCVCCRENLLDCKKYEASIDKLISEEFLPVK